jgi:hypothetical protein
MKRTPCMETSSFHVSFRPSVAYYQRLDRLSDFYKIVESSSSSRYVADAIVLICSKPTGVTGERDVFNRQLHVPASSGCTNKKTLNAKHKIHKKVRSQTSIPVYAACCCLILCTAWCLLVCTVRTCRSWLKMHVISDCHVVGVSSNKCHCPENQLIDGHTFLKGVNELRHVISTCIVRFG